MNRRKLFGLIPLAALLPVTLTAQQSAQSTWIGDQITGYSGWTIWGFTGYKYSQTTTAILGQWLAYKETADGRIYAFANAGDPNAGLYQLGQTIPVTTHTLDITSDSATRENERRAALNRLFAAINNIEG